VRGLTEPPLLCEKRLGLSTRAQIRSHAGLEYSGFPSHPVGYVPKARGDPRASQPRTASGCSPSREEWPTAAGAVAAIEGHGADAEFGTANRRPSSGTGKRSRTQVELISQAERGLGLGSGGSTTSRLD